MAGRPGAQLGEIRGPELRTGLSAGERKDIDLLPLGKTLGIHFSPRGVRTGLREPRELNVNKLIRKGFPGISSSSLRKKEGVL